jgi:multidrug efflux pump subunit AcrA (membrane-fusion protein)
MSPAMQSVDPQSFDNARQRIRKLASEIGQLAKLEDLALEEFYAEFLPRVVAALAAHGGVVWTLENGNNLTPQCQLKLQQTGLLEDPEKQDRHTRLLARCITSGEGMLVPPHSGGENGQGANPTDLLLVLGPLKAEQETVGVVEIFQRPGAGPDVQQGYLRFVVQMCDLAADFLKNRRLRQFSERQTLWTQLEQFIRAAYQSLDSRKTAYTIANEGRQLIGADRVSVAICRGRKCRIEAVSGQDVLDRRSNTVCMLADLAEAALVLDEPFWYSGDSLDLPPQLEHVVERYVDETDTKLVGVLPLRPARTETASDGSASSERQGKAKPIGALVIERIDDCRLLPGMKERMDVVCSHSSAALANALHHEGLFLHGVWDTLGRSRWLVQARTLPKTVAVTVVLVLVAAWLAFWPATFDLTAKGTLEPVLRRDVFAGIDGRVDEIAVEHGDVVQGPDLAGGREGTLLVRLKSDALEEDMAKLAGERLTLAQQMKSIQRQLLEQGLTEVQQNQASAELAELRQKLANLDVRWNLCLRKQKDLTIRAPSDGTVVTWDVHAQLANRPVQRGQRLMQIADTCGPWELDLQVPEDHIGHVIEAQRRVREKADREAAEEIDERLPVTFVLATDPGTKYEGRIKKIHGRAEVRGEEGNTVLIRVEFDKGQLPHLLPGAGVSAQIDCGRCSMGYDLLHDAVAWVQRLWFRW